jgi:hypothetical protein
VCAPEAPLGLILKLVPDVERYPFDEKCERVLGIDVPVAVIAPFETSAPIKAELIRQRIVNA